MYLLILTAFFSTAFALISTFSLCASKFSKLNVAACFFVCVCVCVPSSNFDFFLLCI